MSKSFLLPDGLSRYSRRRFTKSAATALGLAPVFGKLPQSAFAERLFQPSRPIPEDEKLGVALVGLGNYSTNNLAPALQQTGLCKLAGIVTGTPRKAEEWQQRFPELQNHVYNYENFEQIADDDAIDIVYVVLPNSMHAEYTIRAAKAGKHVICEKPMAVSSLEAHAMIDACETADRRLFIGYRLHFEPHNLEAARIGREKVFGKMRYIQSDFGFRIGDPTQWRLRKDLAGGGALVDVGIYALQGARYTANEEPIRVTAQEFKTDPVKFAEVDELITWQMTFPTGCVATCSTSYAGHMHRLFGSAENGWVELRPAYSYSGIQGKTSNGPMDFPQVNQQALQMDAIADSIVNGSELGIDGYEGLRDVKIIEAIYESIRTGSPVELG